MAGVLKTSEGKRIAFICAALEPGRDGVGDYSRRLAGELMRKNCACTVIALNDVHISEMQAGQQEIEGKFVPVLRLPSVMPWDQRVIAARKLLDAFSPDWISLQFVPFGFDNRGLCFGLGKRLAALSDKAAWQVMFHELWLGIGANSPMKHHVLGAMQRFIILDFMKRLNPRVVQTQAEPYRVTLKRKGIAASILPLFGNIPRAQGDGWNEIIKPLLAKETAAAPERDSVYLAGILGMVHPEWSADDAVNVVLPLVQRAQKRLVLVFLGKNGLSPEAIDHVRTTLKGRADVIVAGERSSADISKILQALDFGLATSPREVIQKSGAATAMLEHGLKVLITRDDWHLSGGGLETPPETMSPHLLLPVQFNRLETLPLRDTQSPKVSGVEQIAERMLSALQAT